MHVNTKNYRVLQLPDVELLQRLHLLGGVGVYERHWRGRLASIGRRPGLRLEPQARVFFGQGVLDPSLYLGLGLPPPPRPWVDLLFLLALVLFALLIVDPF